MISGKSFRMETPTAAVDTVGGKPVAILIPAESIVKVISSPHPGTDGMMSGMIDVDWEGRVISMFAVDVENRGTEIEGRSFSAH